MGGVICSLLLNFATLSQRQNIDYAILRIIQTIRIILEKHTYSIHLKMAASLSGHFLFVGIMMKFKHYLRLSRESGE